MEAALAYQPLPLPQDEACGGEDSQGDASIRRGQRATHTMQHTVGTTRRRQHTGPAAAAPAASALAPTPTACSNDPAQDDGVPIPLPRDLLRRVLHSLFDSGLDGQQALACDLALEINAELQRMTARAVAAATAAQAQAARATTYGKWEKKEGAGAGAGGVNGRSSRSSSTSTTTPALSPSPSLRRRTVSSSLSTTVIAEDDGADASAAPPLLQLHRSSASSATASTTIAAPTSAAPVVPAVVATAPSSPSSLSASSAVGTDAFLTSSCSSSASEGEESDAEADEEEEGRPPRTPHQQQTRQAWQQRSGRRGGGRRARRRGQAQEAAAWADVTTLERAAAADAAALARRRGQKQAPAVGPLKVTVVGTEVARDPLNGRAFVQYVLRVSQGQRAREVRRRWSEVLDFDGALSFEAGYDAALGALAPPRPWFPAALTSVFAFPFPSSSSSTAQFDPKLTAQRAAAIEAYLTAVLARRALRSHPLVQEFLGFSLRRPPTGLACAGPASPASASASSLAAF